MKIIKKENKSFEREAAHVGSGFRKVFIAENEVKNYQALTYGYIPAGKKFDLHNHENITEIMIVLKGEGIVRDEDGEYGYAPGDVFIYPPNVMHEIENTGSDEHEFVFVRTKE